MALISLPFPDPDEPRVRGEATTSPQGRTPRFAALTAADRVLSLAPPWRHRRAVSTASAVRPACRA